MGNILLVWNDISLGNSLLHMNLTVFLSVGIVGRPISGCRNDWEERDAGAGSEWKRGCLPSTKHVRNLILVNLYSIVLL